MVTKLLGKRRHGPLVERFWRAVDKTGACWNWTGSVNTWGYGQIRDEDGKYTTAHRISYRLAHGSIPPGQSVLHRCDNTRCVNPEHLFLGSQADNMADKTAKGRQAKGDQHGMSRVSKAKRQEMAS